jgi:hypothetical protein
MIATARNRLRTVASSPDPPDFSLPATFLSDLFSCAIANHLYLVTSDKNENSQNYPLDEMIKLNFSGPLDPPRVWPSLQSHLQSAQSIRQGTRTG